MKQQCSTINLNQLGRKFYQTTVALLLVFSLTPAANAQLFEFEYSDEGKARANQAEKRIDNNFIGSWRLASIKYRDESNNEAKISAHEFVQFVDNGVLVRTRIDGKERREECTKCCLANIKFALDLTIGENRGTFILRDTKDGYLDGNQVKGPVGRGLYSAKYKYWENSEKGNKREERSMRNSTTQDAWIDCGKHLTSYDVNAADGDFPFDLVVGSFQDWKLYRTNGGNLNNVTNSVDARINLIYQDGVKSQKWVVHATADNLFLKWNGMIFELVRT